ncbi:MAG TPA: RNA polymerase sigma factor [Vicinamibacterales bacterium]|nr:RNA polymerase sigma factor [Vicinamibacterales bacterium]
MQNVEKRAGEDPALRILMAEYQAGSAEAFDRLHDALAPDLKAYLTSLARDPTRADDLLQETFLQIHRSRAVHTPGEPVRPWVFAIARRVFLMYRRSAGRRERHELASSYETGAERAVSTEIERLHARRQVESVLRQIPRDGRHAFLLHHLLGFSFREVGARLGIKAGAAKIRSSRAATFMRALLGGSRDE